MAKEIYRVQLVCAVRSTTGKKPATVETVLDEFTTEDFTAYNAHCSALREMIARGSWQIPDTEVRESVATVSDFVPVDDLTASESDK